MSGLRGVIWIVLLLLFTGLPVGALDLGASAGPVSLVNLEGIPRTMDNVRAAAEPVHLKKLAI